MKTLFVSPTHSGLDVAQSVEAIRSALEAQGLKVTQWKPLAGKRTDAASAGQISLDQAETLLSQGLEEELMEQIIGHAAEMGKGADVLLVEGVSLTGRNNYASQVNASLARNLQAQTILLTDAKDVSADELADELELNAQHYRRTTGKGLAGYLVSGALSSEQQTELGKRSKVTLLGQGGKVDLSQLSYLKEEEGERLFSPSAFRYELIQKARAAGKRIVLPEGDEPRTVKAAALCTEKGIAHCILLAKPEKVQAVAQEQGVTLPEGLEIIDPESLIEKYVAPMVELRKSKGLTPEDATKQLQDTVVLGTMMLAQGDVDGLVSGAVHTTANTVRPALQLIKTAPGSKLVSSIFFMLMPEQVLIYGDAAINPNPTAEELADIAIQSADSAKAFGITPRVAMLSYSTIDSGVGPDVDQVKEATAIVREKRPDIMVEGPIQYDAANVLSVGQKKAPGSPVAGRATVYIFPDLNTGNVTYKAVQRAANVVAVGPMLQGLRKPVNDLSRGALVDDIVYTIALTAIQATQTQ